jgi:hypothetical protein
MGDNTHKNSDGRFRFVDLLVILLCLSGAAYSVNLFRLDLLKVFNSKNEKPVGIISVKQNVVQRRAAERVLWDRLTVDSAAYAGDLIRTANQSAAVLHIEDHQIDMEENTLIRIMRSPNGEDAYNIELHGGALSVITGYGGRSITLNIMGRQVEINPDTVLNASMVNDNIVLRVNEGSASFIGGDRGRELPSGTMITLDAGGRELTEKGAIVMQPRLNARYLKSTPEPLQVNFSWVRVNLDPGETLRMEVAEDRYFEHIVHDISDLDASAVATVDIGFWYWRLSLTGVDTPQQFLASGRFTVTDASGPQLISPVTDSLFLYQNDLPHLRFHWSDVEGASSYILEISESLDFINPRFRTQTESVFLINMGLGQGTWYWRVSPVFPSVYEGSTAFSPASFFRIEQGGNGGWSLVLPDSTPDPVPELAIEQPEPVLEPVEPEIQRPVSIPVRLSLVSPAQGTTLQGLTALRQQTVFTWNSDGVIARSRFVLSLNSNPLRGRPVVEINNPGRTVRVNSLEEGVYYWTIEAYNREGVVSVAEPRQLRVSAIPLLPVPGNLQPLPGRHIGIDELRTQTNINFSWSAVQGANSYIFTLYEVTGDGRRQIIRRPLENRTNWTLENFTTLGRGTFVWQVEAVNSNSAAVVEQRGRVAESTFTLEVPAPGPVHIEDPGILYGF